MKATAKGAPASPFFLASIILLSLALVLGGASQGNLIPATIVEAASLLMAPWAVYRLVNEQGVRRIIVPVILIVAAGLVIALQILPLPPTIWGRLPGQDHVKTIYAAAGIGTPWRPISLDPYRTVQSGLALVTGVTVFLSWVTLDNRERRFGIGAILAWLLVGLVLGAVQITSGGQTPAYLYERTSYGYLVGFFSNRNHEASFLLCSLPFAAALMAYANKTKFKASMIVVSLALTFVVVLALAAAKSRAGLLLLAPSLLASFMIASSSGRLFRDRRAWLIVGGLAVVALLLIGKFALEPLMDRFKLSVGDDLRFRAAPDVWRAAMAHLPLGSGLGTFNEVYRSIERLEMVVPSYFNHAHNDYTELLLELGVPGILLVAGGIAWIIARAVKGWASEQYSGVSLFRAGTVVLAILLLHSILDYPLRTLALGAVFGFACALITGPVGHGRIKKRRAGEQS